MSSVRAIFSRLSLKGNLASLINLRDYCQVSDESLEKRTGPGGKLLLLRKEHFDRDMYSFEMPKDSGQSAKTVGTASYPAK